MRTLLLVSALPLLAACATTGGQTAACDCAPEPVRAEAPATPEAARALRLAEALESAAHGDPSRLAEMEARIAALEDALGLHHAQAGPAPTVTAEAAGDWTLADEDAEDAALIAQAQAGWLGLQDGDAPEAEAEPQAVPGGLAPAPDLDGSRSLLHAVHIASYRTPEQVREGWDVLSARHAVLSRLEPRMDAADLGERGAYLRLKAGPFDDAAAARAACEQIEAAGDWCQATGFDGDRIAAR
jgi:hypothetical protein